MGSNVAQTQVRYHSKVKKRNSVLQSIIRNRALLVMMIPTFLFVLLNKYIPIFGVLIAFKKVNYRAGILGSPWVGFENFKFLFQTDAAWRMTRNTILYNVAFIIIGLVLAVAIAIAFSELRNRFGSKAYQTMMIMPHFLSMVVVSYIVYAFLNPEYGFINKVVLESAGGESVNWYSQPKYWPFILLITRMWHNAGYSSILYVATIAGIDQEMYGAAVLDGATKWQQIRHITIPFLRPVMIIILIMSMGGIIKGDFGLFYQVTLDSPMLYPVTDIIDTYVYRSLINLNDIGMSSAAGFYQSVVGCFMVLAANLLVRKIDKDQAMF